MKIRRTYESNGVGSSEIPAKPTSPRDLGAVVEETSPDEDGLTLPVESMAIYEYDSWEAAEWPWETLLYDHIDLVETLIGRKTASTLLDNERFLELKRSAVARLAVAWCLGRVPEGSVEAEDANGASDFIVATGQALRFSPFLKALGERMAAEADLYVWRRGRFGGADLYLVMPSRLPELLLAPEPFMRR